jgi:acyl carrier protein
VDRDAQQAHRGSLAEIMVRVRELLAEVQGEVRAEDIPEDAPLFDGEFAINGFEIDSLDGLKLAVALANEYDLDEAAEVDYARVQTVREIAEYVQSLITTGGER